jgi:hypothetical protein
MLSILQSKEIDWWAGLKSKTWHFFHLQEMHLTNKRKHWFKVKGWKNIFQRNEPWKQTVIAILTANKLDFNTKLVRKQEGHCTLIKGTMLQEELTMVTLYEHNISTPNLFEQTHLDLKAETNPNTMTVEDFITILSQIDGWFRQKLNKTTSELNDTIDQMDIADIYRVFHPAVAQYTVFSVVHRTSSKTGQILGHKTPWILSDHSVIKTALSRHQWLTLKILSTQKAEISRIMNWTSLGK